MTHADSVGTPPSALSSTPPGREEQWTAAMSVPDPGLRLAAFAVRVLGPLDPDVPRRRAGELIEHHPELAERHTLDGTAVVRRPRADATVRFATAEATDSRELDRLVREGARRALPPAGAVSVSVLLVSHGDRHHILLLTAHRSVCDTWDLAALAEELLPGGAPVATPLPGVGGTVSPEPGAGRGTGFPGAAAAALRYPDRLLRRPLAPETGAALTAFADRTGAGTDAVLAGALRVLLHRHTGEGDAPLWRSPRPTVPGSAHAADPRPSATRNPVTAHPSFEHLVRAEPPAGPLRGPGPAVRPAVPGTVACSFDVLEERTVTANGLRFTRHPVPGTGDTELGLTVVRHDDGYALEWTHDRHVLDTALVRRLAERYDVLLAAALADPAARPEDLPVLTGDDLDRAWAEPVEVPPAPPLTELFARAAARFPDRSAVHQGDRTLTYAEADTLSARIAAGLVAEGCGPETRVALLLDRTPDLPAAMLGVLRAGGCCVPLDPDHPRERITHVLADSGARLLVTDGTVPPPGSGARVLTLDQVLDTGREAPPADAPAPHPDQLAYVLHTSGSTGRPKGVMVGHGALANCLEATRRALEPGPGDRFLAVTTVGFDIMLLEMFLPLISGGAAVLTSSGEARSGEDVVALLRRWRPRFLHATPALWEILLIAGWEGDPHLVALCGGDVVSTRLGARLAACTDRVWHLYGPTETTMYALSQRLDPGRRGAVLPLGTAIDGARARILDPRMRPVPPGAVGEVFLGGRCVSRGYVGSPGATAERFVPDPETPGARLYRTGDLARLLPDGSIALCGRNDRQVKIRGHRIEPGEVEHVLTGHADVARAVVVAVPHDGERQLVAFVEPRDRSLAPRARRALATALRRHTEARLPRAMAPARYGVLPRLPLTPNGKADRARVEALRPPERRVGGPEPSPDETRVLAALVSAGWAPGDIDTASGDHRSTFVAATRLGLDFGVGVTPVDLRAAGTVPALATSLVRWAGAAPAPGTCRPHPDRRDGALPPLVIVTGNQVRPWDGVVSALEPDRTVWTLAPGAPVAEAAEAVAALRVPAAPVLVAAGAEAPHAFAVARELDRVWGHRPGLLLVRPVRPEPVPPDGLGGPDHGIVIDQVRAVPDDPTATEAWRTLSHGKGRTVLIPDTGGHPFTGSDTARIAAVVAALH